jgi:hypothetical protein
VYLELQKRLTQHLRAVLAAKYDLQLETIPLEIPPELKFGELATPIAFELARKLHKAPRVIAQEIVAALTGLDGFSSFEVASAGYINARLDRAASVRRTATGVSQVPEAGPGAPSSEAPGSGASQESPYPDEAVYPAVVATAPEAQATVTYPQIQPPSTGAPVAAARPGSLTEQVKEPGSNHA